MAQSSKMWQYIKIGLSFGIWSQAATACPDCQDEQCAPFHTACICVPRIGCKISIPPLIPGGSVNGSQGAVPGVPSLWIPPEIQKQIAQSGKDISTTVEKAGNDTFVTIVKANKDTLKTLQKASGDAVSTVQKAGSDTVVTVQKAADDTTATYIKAWRDTGEQAKRSFNDAVDAGQAVGRYTQREAQSQRDALNNASKRVREGKVIDAMWGLSTEPAQATEKNFAKATQESAVINGVAQAAAAAYGGPAGAAAYAAWSTYRATGDANLALRAGLLSAITSQGGSAISSMPSGTAGEIIKKAALTGAAGGIAVAAAGGDDKAVAQAFLKSGSSVLIQGGTDQLRAYSPKTYEAYEAVQCVSARDVDCLSNTTYARDAKQRILFDSNGKPRIDPATLDPKQYIGNWTSIDPNSVEAKKNAFIAGISKLPNANAIPLMRNQWVMTWTFGRDKTLQHAVPAVVLTYVGKTPPFTSKVRYGGGGAVSGIAPKSAPIVKNSGQSYVCPVNGFNRSVTVSSTARTCVAVYKSEGGSSQIIWKSDHDLAICASKASAFVAQLRNLKIACSTQ